MCTEVTDFYYFDAIPKLMGCLQYYMNCKDLPLLSQEPVIPGRAHSAKDCCLPKDSHELFTSSPVVML